MLERLCWKFLETLEVGGGIARAIDGDLSRCEIDAGLFDMREVVRAILNELKEPSEGMKKAVTGIVWENAAEDPVAEMSGHIFTAMINAILSEGEN